MDPCKFEEKIIFISEKVAATDERYISLSDKIDSAIKAVTRHIEAGSKYRVAIITAWIGIAGLFVGWCTWCGRIDTKITYHDRQLTTMEEQIYDLNYEKGRAVGLSEAKRR